MLDASFAPIKRAFVFFGFMGFAVATLTVGAGFQTPADMSSSSIELAKIQRNIPTDREFAAVDPGAKVTGVAKRAIATSQQARLEQQGAAILR